MLLRGKCKFLFKSLLISLFFGLVLMLLLIRGVGFLVLDGIDEEFFNLFLREDILLFSFGFFICLNLLLVLLCWLFRFFLFDVEVLFL